MIQKISIFIETLAKNPWLVIISFIITFLGFILAFIFYFKSKKVKKPRLESRSLNLLKESAEKIEGLKITYLNENIPNITITKLAIWNDGNDTINKSDIASADPLLITAKDTVHILEYKIIYQKNECSLFDIEEIESGKKLKVTFDFLDFQDGAVIQLLHTGNSSSDIEFGGTIKGVGKIGSNYSKNKVNSIIKEIISKPSKKISSKIIGIIYIILGLILLVMEFGKLLGLDNIYKPVENPMLEFLSCVFFSILTISMGVKISKRRVPKGFEIFDENI